MNDVFRLWYVFGHYGIHYTRVLLLIPRAVIFQNNITYVYKTHRIVALFQSLLSAACPATHSIITYTLCHQRHYRYAVNKQCTMSKNIINDYGCSDICAITYTTIIIAGTFRRQRNFGDRRKLQYAADCVTGERRYFFIAIIVVVLARNIDVCCVAVLFFFLRRKSLSVFFSHFTNVMTRVYIFNSVLPVYKILYRRYCISISRWEIGSAHG